MVGLGKTMNSSKWEKLCIPEDSSIRDAIEVLNRTGMKIVLLLNDSGTLVGTVSDGDIRRGLVLGVGLSDLIAKVANYNPVVVTEGAEISQVRELMREKKIHQIPEVNINRQVVELHFFEDIADKLELKNWMVIMVGGKGSRLMPFTKETPKPLVRIADKPILEHVILRAKSEGFRNFVLAIHHFGDQIEAYFKEGKELGVNIEYLRERSPLGTAGALSIWNPRQQSPFLVTNGDVITDLNYASMLSFHLHHNASATMAVRMHELQNPFGVVEVEGLKLTGYSEKPIHYSLINAGVYVLNPDVLDFLQNNSYCDMPELIEKIRSKSNNVFVYPSDDAWLDVGNPTDLSKAGQVIMKNPT
jgi:dTDP-glucose pyrophosphorylase